MGSVINSEEVKIADVDDGSKERVKKKLTKTP